MPIGIANSLDTLKTFAEPEGCFSPGFGSYGIYFWVFDREAGKLFAPPAGKCKRGLRRQTGDRQLKMQASGCWHT